MGLGQGYENVCRIMPVNLTGSMYRVQSRWLWLCLKRSFPMAQLVVMKEERRTEGGRDSTSMASTTQPMSTECVMEQSKEL